MTVGQRIREVRLSQGLTQEELAAKMGYSGKTSVSAAENCQDNITTTKVMKFAEALGVSYYYLMGYIDENGNKTAIGKLNDIYEKKVERDKEILHLFHNAIKEAQDVAIMVLKAGQINIKEGEEN